MLGNLTIITQSLNASIRDSDWDTKKEGKGRKGGLKAYAGDIKTLFEALKLSEWNEDTINRRAEKLADSALEVWQRY